MPASIPFAATAEVDAAISVQGDSARVVAEEQRASVVPKVAPEQNNPTEVIAAQLSASLTNADAAETPHPAETADAAFHQWRRVNSTSTATEAVTRPTASDDGLIVGGSTDDLADQIRAALDSVNEVEPDQAATPSPAEEDIEVAGADESAVVLSVAAPAVDETPVVEPTYWRANPGVLLTTALEAWAEQDGWSVQNQSGSIWKVTVPVELTGSFEDAATKLVSGFGRAAPRPVIHLYPNKVLIIRRFGDREASNGS